MSEIKPKKERKFLKALGKIGEVLIQELFFRVGSNLIRKIGGKKTLPSILFLFLSLNLFAQFPNTGNKQRLGFQTTGDGLVWRGSISDTASIQPINNQNAWVILDTINLKFYTFDFTSNVWNLVGGAAFTQPVDSLFFNVNVPTNNVDTAKMRWDSDLATVVLGLNDNVPNEIGFKNFWLVKNQTGSTITKGSLVYANGTVGASGRITVAKFIANGSIDAKYLLGITAHDLTDGEDGYVISFGKIRQVNTDTFAAGAILYPSPTVAGVWTDVEPVAPNIDMPIGFCINSSVNNGTIAIRVASGYKLSELHDVSITSPVEKSSLYYSGGLWRDTTAALLVSDTASMLTPYFMDDDTTSLNLTSRFAAKQNTLSNASASVSGILTSTDWNTFNNKQTAIAFAPPLQNQSNVVTISQASSTDNGYLSISDWNTFNNKLNLSDTASMLTNYLRTGTAASTYLPLTGGTLTGTINRQEGSHDGSASTFYYNILNYFAKRDNNKGNQTAQITFTDRPGTLNFPNNVRTSDIYLMTARNWNGTSLGQYLDTTLSIVANQDGGRIGISKLNPEYKLDVNGTFNASGNSLIGGTLGVTGATTLTGGINGNIKTNGAAGPTSTPDNIWLGNSYSNGTTRNKLKIYLYNSGTEQYGFSVGSVGDVQYHSNATHDFYIANSKKLFISNSNTTTDNLFTVNNAAVFNENSGDNDFRVESDGNANMVFVDASTDRVGIGYASPTKTLDVNGEVRINTVTATPISLLGKDGSNVVGEVTTVAQTGLMTRGETTATTGSPSATFTVTHSLGATPTSVLVTSAGIAGAEKIIFEVYSKNSTTFSVQAWNYDGTEASSKSVKIFWLAIK